MKIALITGPSGAGKDYVSAKLSEEFRTKLSIVSVDKVYQEAVQIVFPFFLGDRWNHPIWEKNIDFDHDFITAFRIALGRLKAQLPNEMLVIQGVQLRRKAWRSRLLEAAMASVEDRKIFATIMPEPEVLLELRRSSDKPYHQSVATLCECRESLKYMRKCLDDEPVSEWDFVELPTKEECLARAREFFHRF